ncbi:MAG TPA: helicase C-terminal domain-containing protein, partial [Kiritimatiellia bacterium]|nr:helicase C-terminal domain-containing protein [Kiritimatiellia bacterium]
AFVLFTSAQLMKKVAELSRDALESAGLTMLVQGAGMPRHVMLERFRRGGGAVLFGLDSFWMGVDVRGEALSNVIITRLPFAVPDQPLIKARMDRIREKGGDPFRDYSLPEAILKFRQGVGRLIRTQTDEGIIVILDSRILAKWYGKMFLSSIPECPVEIVEGD